MKRANKWFLLPLILFFIITYLLVPYYRIIGPMITDESGNIYRTSFSFSTLFRVVIIEKYNSQGIRIWINRESIKEEYYSIDYLVIDNQKNIYAYISPGKHNWSSFGIPKYLHKYDSNGKLVWKKEYKKAPKIDELTTIFQQLKKPTKTPFSIESEPFSQERVIDSRGNIYEIGCVVKEVNGDVGHGNADAYLVKYDSSGKFLWFRRFGTKGYDGADDAAVDVEGNIYVCGTVWNNTRKTMFGKIKPDIFVTKFDSDGRQLWSQNLDVYANEITRIASDFSGNSYISGFKKFLNDDARIFTKLDESGHKVWIKGFDLDSNNFLLFGFFMLCLLWDGLSRIITKVKSNSSK